MELTWTLKNGRAFYKGSKRSRIVFDEDEEIEPCSCDGSTYNSPDAKLEKICDKVKKKTKNQKEIGMKISHLYD